jgi:putative transposase
MARPPRNVVPGIPLHIVQRGNNRQSIFFAKRDYIRFLDDLQDAATRYNCNLHAYVLMTNHVHLLVTPNDTVYVMWKDTPYAHIMVKIANDK